MYNDHLWVTFVSDQTLFLGMTGWEYLILMIHSEARGTQSIVSKHHTKGSLISECFLLWLQSLKKLTWLDLFWKIGVNLKNHLRLKISLVMSKLSIIQKISCEIFHLNPILLAFNAATNFNMLFGVLTAYLGYFYAQVTLIRLTGFWWGLFYVQSWCCLWACST